MNTLSEAAGVSGRAAHHRKEANTILQTSEYEHYPRTKESVYDKFYQKQR